MDEDVIPMTIAFLRERLGAEAEPAVALIQARNDFGTAKYGKPLTSFDGRNTIADAQEEAADLLNYLTKLRHEWDEVAGMLERAAIACEWWSGKPMDPPSAPIVRAQELRDTAARMRQDIARIEPNPSAYRTPAERLAAMDVEGAS